MVLARIQPYLDGARSRFNGVCESVNKNVIQTRPVQLGGRVISGAAAASGAVAAVSLTQEALRGAVACAPALAAIPGVSWTIGKSFVINVVTPAVTPSIVPVVVLGTAAALTAYGTCRLAQHTIHSTDKPKTE